MNLQNKIMRELQDSKGIQCVDLGHYYDTAEEMMGDMTRSEWRNISKSLKAEATLINSI